MCPGVAAGSSARGMKGVWSLPKWILHRQTNFPLRDNVHSLEQGTDGDSAGRRPHSGGECGHTGGERMSEGHESQGAATSAWDRW